MVGEGISESLAGQFGISSSLDSGGELGEDVLEDRGGVGDNFQFSVSSLGFHLEVLLLLLADSSDGGEGLLGELEELESLDKLGVGDVQLVGEVLDLLGEFDDLSPEVVVFSLHVGLEDSEVFGSLDFVLGELVSGVLEVEDEAVNHDDDLLVEFVDVDVDLGVADVLELLELSLGVVDVLASDFLGGSLLLGSGGIDFFAEGVNVAFDVGGGDAADDGHFHDHLGDFKEDSLVFVVEEVGELGESLDEGSVDLETGLLLEEVVVDVLFEEGHDVDGFHMLSELLDEQQVVVASLFLEVLEHLLVGHESVLSGLLVLDVLGLLVLEPLDVLLELVDVSLSAGD